MRLGNVSPRLLADYRADTVTLDQLMAPGLTDDHEAQETAFYDAWNEKGRSVQVH
jgi:ParB family chromosome partitioning protein